MKMLCYFTYCLLLLLQCFFNLALAGIMAETTRLIFPEGATERSLMLANSNEYSVLVQAWVDNGDVNNTPEKIDSPFIVLPTVFKMSAGEIKGIRVLFKNQRLPKDRESVFWLNLYEIPPTGNKTPSTDDAKLLVAMNTQMKIFYRPKQLTKKIDTVLKSLQFRVVRENNRLILTCYNPTAYYASFASIKLMSVDKIYDPETKLDMMVAPFERGQFVFKTNASFMKGQKIDLEFVLITDTGASQKAKKQSITIGQ